MTVSDGAPGAADLVFTGEGPLLVRGPVVVEMPDGSRVRSERPVSALCLCKRTRRPPFCDTSHRRRTREPADHDSGHHDSSDRDSGDHDSGDHDRA